MGSPSKSLSLSLGGYFGDVNSCLWLVTVATRALDVELNLSYVFEGDELAKVLDVPLWR